MRNIFTQYKYRVFCVFTAALLAAGVLMEGYAQTLAFPGAEGFGRFATGARGVANPEVYVVTNLNDSGPGSFRDAVSQPGRFVVFAVGGIIKLESQVGVAANTTIAGQTAPGDGIVLFNKRVTFSGADNTIARYLRIRLGVTDNFHQDASGISNGANIILDHMSITWGMDEVFSVNWDGKGTSIDNITIQNSVIGQGLHRDNHSAGGLIQTPDGGRMSLIKNLYISNKTRNPKVKGTNEFVNNVVYNWGNGNRLGDQMDYGWSGDAYIMGGSEGDSRVNIINNYFVGGPLTPPDEATPFSRGTPTFHLYGSGNYFDNNKDGVLNGTLVPFDATGYPGIAAEGFRTTPFSYPEAIPDFTAEEAYHYVIDHVGPNYPSLDQVDSLLVAEVISRGTAGFYVYRETDLPFSNGGVGEVFSAPAPLDTDSDGMPDSWEDTHGLNKNDPSDAVAFSTTVTGYLNIEVYINTLTDSPAPSFIKPPSAVVLEAITAPDLSGSQVEITWKDNSENETLFILERSGDGTVYTEIAQPAENVTVYTDPGLAANTIYYYRLKAVNATDTSVYSQAISVMTPGLPETPSQPLPEDLSSYEGSSNINLGWSGSDNVTTYKVYLGTDAGNPAYQGEVTAPGYLFEGLADNMTYYWRVDAINEYGTVEGDLWTFTTQTLRVPALVGYWNFDAVSGTVAADQSTYGNTGTLVDIPGPQWVTGIINNAIDLGNSTTSSHIKVEHDQSLHFDENSFSVSFWMKAPPDYPTDQAYIFNKGEFGVNEATGGTGQWFGLELTKGLLRFAVDDNDEKTELTISDNSPFLTGNWVHVVAMRDTENDRLAVYRDGVLVAEKTDNTNAPIGTSLPLIIGNSSILAAPYLGLLDEMKVYNYSLSQEEIDVLYAEGGTGGPKADMPSPANGAINIEPAGVELTWNGNADAYALYMGTAADNLVLEAEGLTDTSYALEDLENSTTYFWRIDGRSGEEITQGDVWSFSTTAVAATGDLVGHWSLDAASGLVVGDVSTFGNDGQLVDLTESGWTAGKRGNAFDFSGAVTTSHIKVPHQDQLFLDQQAFSISFWMKAPEDYPSDQSYLINKGEFGVNEETGGTGQWFGVELKDGLMRFAVDDNDDKSELSISDNSPFLTGEWVHVVAIRNIENDRLLLYRNGEMVAETTDKTDGPIGTTLPLIIGNSSILAAPYRGMLDEVKMFNYSLSPAEIEALYTGIPVLAKASDPSPVHESTDVNPAEVVFGWTGNGDTYNLYLGTQADNLTLAAEGLTTPSFAVSGLSNNNTYLWRVDAVRGEKTVAGDVWSFATPAGELVGHWSLNAASGVIADDESAYGNNGQLMDLTDAGWVPGKEGNAFDFSGTVSTSHINVPHQDQLFFDENSFSVSFWMKAPPDYPEDQAYLINKGEFGVNEETGGTGQWFGLELKDGLMRFAVDDNDDKTELTIRDNSPFLTGEWVHVVAVRDTENDRLVLYRNGEVTGETTDKTNGPIGTTLPLIIGNSSVLTAPYRGLLDEVKVFNYSLSASEIIALYTGIPVAFIVIDPAPENGAEGVDPAEVELQWTGNAPAYNLYLGTEEDNLQLKEEGLTEMTYTLTDLTHSTTYFWRIDPVVETETGTGPVWSFTTREPVHKPSLPSPEDGATGVEPVGLVLGWTGNAETYNLYIGTAEDDLQLVGEGLTEGLYATTELAFAKTYFWRVEATTGTEVATGELWSFSTRESISKVASPFPADGAADIDTDPEAVVLEWSGNAAYYDVYVGTDPENMELIVYGISGTSYTIFWSLEAGTQYFWRVDARSGEEEKTGDTWNFTTHSVTGLEEGMLSSHFLYFPNPFSERLRIQFRLGSREHVTLAVYNSNSQLIHTVVDDVMEQGLHNIALDIRNSPLNDLGEGIYFCVFQTSKQKLIEKVVYIRN